MRPSPKSGAPFRQPFARGRPLWRHRQIRGQRPRWRPVRFSPGGRIGRCEAPLSNSAAFAADSVLSARGADEQALVGGCLLRRGDNCAIGPLQNTVAPRQDAGWIEAFQARGAGCQTLFLLAKGLCGRPLHTFLHVVQTLASEVDLSQRRAPHESTSRLLKLVAPCRHQIGPMSQQP